MPRRWLCYAAESSHSHRGVFPFATFRWHVTSSPWGQLSPRLEAVLWHLRPGFICNFSSDGKLLAFPQVLSVIGRRSVEESIYRLVAWRDIEGPASLSADRPGPRSMLYFREQCLVYSFPFAYDVFRFLRHVPFSQLYTSQAITQCKCTLFTV